MDALGLRLFPLDFECRILVKYCCDDLKPVVVIKPKVYYKDLISPDKLRRWP
jgi:hypothetical protein